MSSNWSNNWSNKLKRSNLLSGTESIPEKMCVNFHFSFGFSLFSLFWSKFWIWSLLCHFGILKIIRWSWFFSDIRRIPSTKISLERLWVARKWSKTPWMEDNRSFSKEILHHNLDSENMRYPPLAINWNGHSNFVGRRVNFQTKKKNCLLLYCFINFHEKK